MKLIRYANSALSVCVALAIGALFASEAAYSRLHDWPEQRGLYAGPEPVVISDVVSREFAFNNTLLIVPEIADVVSREFTFNNSKLHPPEIADVVSRELTFNNTLLIVSEIGDVVSREFTFNNTKLHPPEIGDVVSREFTFNNTLLIVPEIADVMSREFTFNNTKLHPPEIADVVSREFTVANGFVDCNENDIRDQCDLDCGPKGGFCDVEGCGQSNDCNDNGVPDECEVPPIGPPENDCNNNEIPDDCELEGNDCDGNEVPDECDPDCNENGTPDACDIEGGGSTDCDGDGIPDECEIPPNGPPENDCNNNGVHDACDIADCPAEDAACQDCDGNGEPDECQLPESCDDGICTVDCDPDCNINCTLDACDIADCPQGELDCNDCNLNGIPDLCDDPIDSIPDECIEFDGGCEKGDNRWTCDENWEGDIVPDNSGDVTFSVTLIGSEDDVFLDADITIDTLRILPDATLSVTQAGEGDFTVVEPGGILVEGDLLVANDRLIDATAGAVTIGPGGVYQADPDAKGPVTATLQAGSITISSGPPEAGGGGSMMLSGSMAVVTTGDLHMNNDGGGKGCDTPPDLEMIADATLTIGNDFTISTGACLSQNSSQAVSLEGDFDNRSIDFDNFEWFDVEGPGELRMNGTAQTIEAAGEDRGPWPAGLVDNFAFKTLTLEAGAVVEVDDTFDNQQDGVVACDEALYVGHLIVEPGAVLLTDGCRVYYIELTNDGAVPDLGIHVLQIGESIPQDLNCDGEVGPFDLASLLAAWGGCAQPCDADDSPPPCPGDSNGDGVINPVDLASLLAAWGAIPF